MKNIFRSLGIFALALVFQSCTSTNDVHVSSPNGKFRFELLTEDSQLYYRAFFDGKEIIGKSILGFELSDTSNITQILEINEVKESKVATDWKPVYGEKTCTRINTINLLLPLVQRTKKHLSSN